MDQTNSPLVEVRANESRHHYPARAPRRRAAARALAHGHLQRAGDRREPLQERLRPDRRAAQTPLRADSEPGRSRQRNAERMITPCAIISRTVSLKTKTLRPVHVHRNRRLTRKSVENTPTIQGKP